jgi:hypothetical protein
VLSSWCSCWLNTVCHQFSMFLPLSTLDLSTSFASLPPHDASVLHIHIHPLYSASPAPNQNKLNQLLSRRRMTWWSGTIRVKIRIFYSIHRTVVQDGWYATDVTASVRSLNSAVDIRFRRLIFCWEWCRQRRMQQKGWTGAIVIRLTDRTFHSLKTPLVATNAMRCMQEHAWIVYTARSPPPHSRKLEVETW